MRRLKGSDLFFLNGMNSICCLIEEVRRLLVSCNSLTEADIDHSARPCSSEFLVTLAEDLLCMNDQLIKWTHHEVNRAKSRRILLALLSELQRLKDNRGLFAVDMDYIEFFNMIDVILQNFVKPDDMKKIENRKFKPAAHKFLQSIRADELFDHQGAFDFRRTVWQQFFHHLAPGVNHIHPQLVRAPSTHFVTKHVIPPGGLEIMREWEANIEEARKRNNPVRVTLSLLGRFNMLQDMPYPGHPVAFPSSIRGFSVFRNQGQSQRHTTLVSSREPL